MSRANVLIALLVAAALGAIAVFLTIGPGRSWRGSGGAGGGFAEAVDVGERLLANLRPSSVHRLVVTRSDGRVDELRRGDRGWSLMSLGGARDDSDPVWWPIAGERISSMLRILSEARAVAKSESLPIDVLGMDGTIVEIETDDASAGRFVVIFADRTMGGVGTAIVTQGDVSRVASVEAGLIDVFVRPGPSGWRDARLLASLDGSPTRVSVEGSAGRVELRRVDGLWRLQEPAGGAAADEQAVQRLLSTLGSMQIVDFLDAGDSAGIGAGVSAVCTVELRTEVSGAGAGAGDGSGSAEPATLRLQFGPVTDAGNTTRVVDLESSRLVGKAKVLAGPAAVEDWPGDPANFVRKAALLVPATDIGLIVIDDLDPSSPGTGLTDSASPALRVARRLERWVEWDGANMPERMLADNAAEGVRGVVRFLREQPADAIVLTRPTPGYQRIGRLVVGSVGGSPLAQLELGTLDGVVPVIRDGSVWRIYAASSLPETFFEAMTKLASAADAGLAEPPAGGEVGVPRLPEGEVAPDK